MLKNIFSKSRPFNKFWVIASVVGLITGVGLLLEARYLAIHYTVVWATPQIRYWYYVTHFSGAIVLLISFLLLLAHTVYVFMAEPIEIDTI
jgi:hypothetical protein